MRRLSPILLLSLAMLVGCTTGPTTDRIDNPIVQRLTIDNIGTCRGLFVWEGSLWMYGQRGGEGVIKRLQWVGPNDDDKPMLRDTGETYELKLYRNRYSRSNAYEMLPRNLIPHPAGLTHHEKYDAFIGNTVDHQGTIYAIHFLGLTESGSLDDWIMNKVDDDLASNGSRPEFVRYNGRWLIATADGGDQGNQLRLYDPEKLKTATKTSEPGVLVKAFDCVSNVQSMHWIDDTQTLVLVQHQEAGLADHLILMKFGDGPEPPMIHRTINIGQPTEQFTGFALVAPGWAVMSSANNENNLAILRWPIE